MAQADQTVLTVSELTVRIESRVIIEDVSFTVTEGEILTILGPNGAGKTVLLRALLGLLPFKGSIVWSRGLTIGYVPQRLPYIRDIPLSVADFFALKGDGRASVREMLGAVGLGADLASERIGDLSSGQFQRVLIAWGLVGDPDVLLFDEPTAGIDIGGEETVYGLLARVHHDRNLTMLLVTHDLTVVYEFSSRVLCLNKRTVCQGPPVTVLTPARLRQLYGSDVKYYEHNHR
jgi:zinc transport system ATP-binding protein